MKIDLNADLGEGMSGDDDLLSIVTSANIATGAHAGGGDILARAVATAVERGVSIGAHPSYRDSAGFGRASLLHRMVVDPAALSAFTADLVDQILLVARHAHRHHRALTHVKAHGSLYNEAVRDQRAAALLVEATVQVTQVLGYPVAVLTQPQGELARLAGESGLQVLAEGFADRRYAPDGRLVPRDKPGAVHGDVATMVDQALQLAGGALTSSGEMSLAIAVDSLCVHGDTPGAVQAARAVRAALEARGWIVDAPRRAGEPADGARRPSVAAFGDRALLVHGAGGRVAGQPAWVVPAADRAARQWPQATVVPGLDSVLVAFDLPSERPDPRDTALVQSVVGPAGGPPGVGGVPSTANVTGDVRSPRTHRLPTRYVGPDLADVAELVRVPSAELIARHSTARWVVAAVGFSPGFGYLTCDDPLFLGIGRRSEPRTKVPKGSVALAAGMCAVYPSPSPGGWQLIGETDVDLFDVRAERPATLAVGDRVQFLPVPR